MTAGLDDLAELPVDCLDRICIGYDMSEACDLLSAYGSVVGFGASRRNNQGRPL